MLKVLVVDDEPPIRQWLAYCVDQFEDFTLAGSAASALQGLELYQRELPDIVVTDIEMPGMDGIEMLRRMSELRPAHMIILTSHEDFSYARRALSQGTAAYILKTEIDIQSFHELLQKAADEIRAQGVAGGKGKAYAAQRLLQQLAAGAYHSDLSPESLRRQGLALENGPVLVADVWSREGAAFPQLRRLLAEQPGLENLYLAPYGYEHLLVAANLRGGSCRELAELLEAEARGWVAGLCDTELGALPEALRLAQARCHLHYYQPGQRVFWQDHVGEASLRRGDALRISFSKEIFAGNYREAAEIKDQALREIWDDRPTDLGSVRRLCAFFATTLLHLTEGRDTASVEARIFKSESFREVEDILAEIFAPFESGLPRPASYSEPIREAVAYIKAHYPDRLTLATVAGVVSFNPEYFSRRFAKETGLNFVVYLNNLRMERAVELLERTDKKIYEIAEEVGFSRVSYFSTAFKKNFGLNPYEYQKKARGQ